MAEKKEKSQVTKYFIQRIQEWLDSEMERDAQFKARVESVKDTKTVEGACNYVSARDKNNIRLETVEVSTKTWNIVQSRGLCNNPSKRHDDIIKLVTKNMYKFKKVA